MENMTRRDNQWEMKPESRPYWRDLNIIDFFYSFLVKNGPMSIFDTEFMEYTELLTDKSKERIDSCGGIANYLGINQNFKVVGNVVSAEIPAERGVYSNNQSSGTGFRKSLYHQHESASVNHISVGKHNLNPYATEFIPWNLRCVPLSPESDDLTNTDDHAIVHGSSSTNRSYDNQIHLNIYAKEFTPWQTRTFSDSDETDDSADAGFNSESNVLTGFNQESDEQINPNPLESTRLSPEYSSSLPASDCTDERSAHSQVKYISRSYPGAMPYIDLLPHASSNFAHMPHASDQPEFTSHSNDDTFLMPHVSYQSEFASHSSNHTFLMPHINQPEFMPHSSNHNLMPNNTQPEFMPHSSNHNIMPNTTQPEFMPHSSNHNIMPNTTQPEFMPHSSNHNIMPNTTQPEFMPHSSNHNMLMPDAGQQQNIMSHASQHSTLMSHNNINIDSLLMSHDSADSVLKSYASTDSALMKSVCDNSPAIQSCCAHSAVMWPASVDSVMIQVASADSVAKLPDNAHSAIIQSSCDTSLGCLNNQTNLKAKEFLIWECCKCSLSSDSVASVRPSATEAISLPISSNKSDSSDEDDWNEIEQNLLSAFRERLGLSSIDEPIDFMRAR